MLLLYSLGEYEKRTPERQSHESKLRVSSQHRLPMPSFLQLLCIHLSKVSVPGLWSVKNLGFVGDRGMSLMREGATKGLRRVASLPLGKPLGASPGASTFLGRRNWAAREFPGIRTMELRD